TKLPPTMTPASPRRSGGWPSAPAQVRPDIDVMRCAGEPRYRCENMRRAPLPLSLAIACMAVVPAAGQTQQPDAPREATLFDHSDNTRWWLSGQLNLITQWHGRFTSPYDGPHSLQADPEHATSRLWTVFTGYRLAEHTEVFVN